MNKLFIIDLMPFLYKGHFVFLRNPRMTASGINTSALLGLANGLQSILDGLGVKTFGQVGETFDPQLHNAVMHKEDESLGESVIAEVFQTGFKVGEKVVRHAMVVVAN